MEKILFFIGVSAVTIGVNLLVWRYILKFILDNRMFHKLDLGEAMDESIYDAFAKEKLNKIMESDLSPQLKKNHQVWLRQPTRIEQIMKLIGIEATRIGLLLLVGAFYRSFQEVWSFGAVLLICFLLPSLINQLVFLVTMFIWAIFKFLLSVLRLTFLAVMLICCMGVKLLLRTVLSINRWFLFRRLSKEERYWYKLLRNNTKKNNINIL